MNILLTGASGFIGQALLSQLTAHRVYCLVRRPVPAQQLQAGIAVRSVAEIDQPLDAVINLAGENIGARRWTPARKQALRASRVLLTQSLGEQLSAANQQPGIWINASAVGYYGNRPGESLHEESACGDDFAARLCQDWEQAAARAVPQGARLSIFRLGVVMGDGGVLAKLALPFRLGLGSVMGPGPQFMPWVSLDDAVAALCWALQSDCASGVYNLVGAEALSQQQFARQLAAHYRRPCWLRMPAWVLRLLMGEMSSLLLVDQKVSATRLQAQGFEFRHQRFADALEAIAA